MEADEELFPAEARSCVPPGELRAAALRIEVVAEFHQAEPAVEHPALRLPDLDDAVGAALRESFGRIRFVLQLMHGGGRMAKREGRSLLRAVEQSRMIDLRACFRGGDQQQSHDTDPCTANR